MERIPPPHRSVVARDLDDVVTGSRVAAQAQSGNGPGVDDEQALQFPRVGHMLMTGEHEMDTRALQALDRITGVVNDVPLAPGARDRQQVVMQHEDAQLGRLGRELLLDPPVAAPPDLPVVEIGLGRVDRTTVAPPFRSTELRSPINCSKCT